MEALAPVRLGPWSEPRPASALARRSPWLAVARRLRRRRARRRAATLLVATNGRAPPAATCATPGTVASSWPGGWATRPGGWTDGGPVELRELFLGGVVYASAWMNRCRARHPPRPGPLRQGGLGAAVAGRCRPSGPSGHDEQLQRRTERRPEGGTGASPESIARTDSITARTGRRSVKPWIHVCRVSTGTKTVSRHRAGTAR